MKLFPRGIVAKPFRLCLAVLFPLIAVSCNGLFSSVYDDADDNKTETTESQIIMDASSWQNWYYISFDSLETLREQGDMAKLKYAQTHFTPYPIPMTPTGDKTASHPRAGHHGAIHLLVRHLRPRPVEKRVPGVRANGYASRARPLGPRHTLCRRAHQRRGGAKDKLHEH